VKKELARCIPKSKGEITRKMEKKPNEIGDDNEQMIEDNNEDSGHDRVME
jgi:hypothetical protein